MKIRGILFDLGNVLIDYRPEIFISRLSELSGISKEKLARYFLTAPADIAYTEGKISSKEFFEAVSRDLGLRCELEDFRNFWCDIFFEKNEMSALAARLKEDYPVWVLSNTNEWHFEFLKARFMVLGIPDRHFLSYELKCQKPNPEIYQHVIQGAGLKPEEIFFVDDIEVNVLAAKKAGIHASVFTTAVDLNRELNQLGVLP